MCGIAGYSLSPESPARRTLAAQALLAGIAERGADAVGYAARGGQGTIEVTKLRGGASALLDEIALPATAEQALIHVRDYTKGHPEIEANNHPIRHGTVVGIHNGIIENDDELFARYGLDRAERDMTVDSEAIFALMELRQHAPRALGELRGAMAAAWLDEREPATLFLARGVARPLWIGRTRLGSLLRVDPPRARDRGGRSQGAPRADGAARRKALARRSRTDRARAQVSARQALSRGRISAAGARPAGGRLLPRAARSADGSRRLSASPQNGLTQPSASSRTCARARISEASSGRPFVLFRGCHLERDAGGVVMAAEPIELAPPLPRAVCSPPRASRAGAPGGRSRPSTTPSEPHRQGHGPSDTKRSSLSRSSMAASDRTIGSDEPSRHDPLGRELENDVGELLDGASLAGEYRARHCDAGHREDSLRLLARERRLTELGQIAIGQLEVRLASTRGPSPSQSQTRRPEALTVTSAAARAASASSQRPAGT